MKFPYKRDDFQPWEQAATQETMSSFSDNRLASYYNDTYLNIGTGKSYSYAAEWEDIVRRVNDNHTAEIDGSTSALDVAMGSSFENPGYYIGNQGMYDERKKRLEDEILANPDIYPDLQDIRDRDFDSLAKDRALSALEAFNETDRKQFGFKSWSGQMVGSAQAFIEDPFNIGMGLAGSVWSMGAKTVLGGALREGLLAMGIEGIQQPSVAKWYGELGLDYGWDDFFTRVTTAGVAATGITATLGYGLKGAGIGYNAVKKGLKATQDAGVQLSPEALAAIKMAEDSEHIGSQNPYYLGTGSQTVSDAASPYVVEASPNTPTYSASYLNSVHFDNVRAADDALRNGSPARINVIDDTHVAVEVFQKFGKEFHGARYLAPSELISDAATFQYKEGGDKFGVTDRLQDVDVWDPTQANIAIAYERADGTLVIADGHQRLGLAKRIEAQGDGQKPKLLTYVLREADGWTTDEVRLIAAVKNISEGTGKATDAAKIMKVDPAKFAELPLPPRSALVRDAQGLVRLSDDMFGLVINDMVPSNYAAMVGRMISDDPELQEAAMRVIMKADPSNEFQAMSMIQQVKETGFERMTQDGLFGDEIVAESFFVERAKILDQAQKILRKDKSAFEAISKNADRYEAEGNVLNKTNNARRLSNETQTLATIQALAHNVGPISDALTRAAKQFRETGNASSSAREFVDSIREAIAKGDLDGLSSGEYGRYVDDSGKVFSEPAKPKSEDFSGFSDLKGEAVVQQTKQLDDDVLNMIAASKAAFDEDAYIRLINPEGIRIPDLNMDTSIKTVDDFIEYVDVPFSATRPENMVAEINGIEYFRWENDFYAYDKAEGWLVGYQKRAEDGADLNVAMEYRGKGIGSELNFLYRSQDPKAPSGGLTEAGEAVARKTFRRLNDIKISDDPSLHFNMDVEGIQMIPMSAITPTRSRGEGMLSGRAFMKQAEEGTRTKRNPAELRDNGDGTYTLWDGNSTYALAVEAGYSYMPARVLDAEGYAAAGQAKNMERILDPQGKVKMRIISAEESDKNVFSEFMAQMLERQPSRTVDEALAEGQIAHDQLQEALSEITSKLGIEGWERAPVKGRNGVLRKINTKYAEDAGFDITSPEWTPDLLAYRLTDIARGGMTIARPEQALAVLKELNKKFHVIDEGFSQTPAGYFDAKALVVMENGILAELQFWPPQMLEVKQSGDLTRFKVWPEKYIDDAGKEQPFVGGHALYEIARLKDDNSPVMRSVIDQNGMTAQQARDAATEHMNIIYGEVLDSLDPDSWGLMIESFKKERASSKSAPKSTAKEKASSSEISGDRSSFIIDSGFTGAQRADLRSQEYAVDMSSDIATSQMPSALKNLIDDTSSDSVAQLDNMSDLFDDQLPTGEVIVDEFGNQTPVTQTMAEMKAEFDRDAVIMNVIKGCQL